MNIESFSSFFTDRIVDTNGVSVTDINKGIKKLYNSVVVPTDNASYNMFVITEEDQGFPDLIAHKYFGDQNLWYFFLLTNGLEDPFVELSLGWAYGIVDYAPAKNAIDVSEEKELTVQSRIGSTITLN